MGANLEKSRQICRRDRSATQSRHSAGVVVVVAEKKVNAHIGMSGMRRRALSAPLPTPPVTAAGGGGVRLHNVKLP